jgi:hypothetical protein
MKRQHKVNFGWQRPAEPISDSYQRELDRTADKAEIRWRRAQRALERAERAKEQAEARARQEPTPQTLADRDEARMAVLARLAELREIEALMRPGNRPQPEVVHRTGRQDRLEVGVYKKPKKNRRTR